MSRFRMVLRPAVCASVALWMAGCGGSGDKAPPLAKVKGTVTIDQKPLTKGTVQFLPDATRGTKGRMALGEIGSDGTFELTTTAPGDGAQVGHHKVTVQAYDVAEFDPNNPKPPGPSKSLIPELYSDPKTSPLTAEVKSGEENAIPLELKSKP